LRDFRRLLETPRAAEALRLDREDEEIQLGCRLFIRRALAEIAAVVGEDLLDRLDMARRALLGWLYR
jgi:hypothetical protein